MTKQFIHDCTRVNLRSSCCDAPWKLCSEANQTWQANGFARIWQFTQESSHIDGLPSTNDQIMPPHEGVSAAIDSAWHIQLPLAASHEQTSLVGRWIVGSPRLPWDPVCHRQLLDGCNGLRMKSCSDYREADPLDSWMLPLLPWYAALIPPAKVQMSQKAWYHVHDRMSNAEAID